MTALAKRLVQPDHDTGPTWVQTLGPAVADLNASMGFAPDPQQEHCLDKIFAIRPDGLSACFEYGCVVCRQNLKTGLLKQVANGWLFVCEVPWFVWSAHELATTLESMREIHELIAESPLSSLLPATKNGGLYEDNNKPRIELANGQRIAFRTRTISGGRGLAAPKVILDEAFKLTPSQVGSLVPALAAQEDPQVIYASSHAKADAVVLADLCQRGRLGSSPRLGYDEWRADREPCRDDRGQELDDCEHPKDAATRRPRIDCALDREHLRLQANPTVTTGRITLETLDGLRQALPPAEFARECMGWEELPDTGAAATFGPGRWEACAVPEPDEDAVPAALGLAVSRDRAFASIAAAYAVEVPDPDDPDEVTERYFVAAVRRDDDTDWAVAELKRLQDKYDCSIVIDKGGPAGELEDALDEADIAVEYVGLSEYATACDRFYRRVRSGELMHPSSEELDDAVTGAEWRWVVDQRVWGRKQSVRDVSMLEAATLAAYGAEEFGAAIW